MYSARASLSNHFDEEYNPFASFTTTTVITANMPVVERKGSASRSFFDGFKFQKAQEAAQSRTEEVDPRSKTAEKEKRLGPSRAYSVNETSPLEQEPKRSLSSAFADAIFRRGSDMSNKSRATSPQRKASEAPSEPKVRKGSFFASSNPDVDSQVPRKLSTASGKSSDNGSSRNNSIATPSMERRPSYVPRNATSSFLNSTSTRTADETAKIQDGVSAAGARRASLAPDTDATGGRTSGAGMPTGRRPSGMVPGNIAAKYMRTASESGESGHRGRTGSAEGKVTAVYMAPDSHQIWQTAVARSQARPSFSRADTSDRHGPGRMPSISDVREESTSPAPVPSAPEVRVHAPSPAKVRKQFSIDTFKANVEKSKADQSRADSAKMLEDQISPRAGGFDQSISGRFDDGDRRPESPLESLGFRGAVPA